MGDDKQEPPGSGVWRREGDVSTTWSRATPNDDVTYVLHGRLQDLPQARATVVRIFLSSTFTDMAVERNALIQRVYPKLKTVCKDKFGLDFQIVDMRWGVRYEAFDDHSGSELCINELRMCQKVSLGPTFVALLGQRYGSRPLPAKISATHMDVFKQCLRDNLSQFEAEDVSLVDSWYRRDDNEVSAVYVLQPLSVMARAAGSEGDGEGQDLWAEVSPKLTKVIRQCARLAVEARTMEGDAAHLYMRSVTEEEIVSGLLGDPQAADHCLCFMRTLRDIDLLHDKAWRFIDQTPGTRDVDHEAQSLLADLRDNKVLPSIPRDNLFSFEVPWSADGGVNERDHAGYLTDFCETFERAMLGLVERGYRAARRTAVDLLYGEVLEHGHQAVSKCHRFHGRVDVLREIQGYVMSSEVTPMVIHGESGCGKTSILAVTAMKVLEWIGNSPDLVVILRFLGTTPDTSTIYSTLHSICCQLIRTLSLDRLTQDLPMEFRDLKDTFLDLLDMAPQDKRVLLLLDSLDQLSPIDAAHDLTWLPTTLPANVKLILSTLPNEYKLLDTLRDRNYPKSQYVAVEELDTETSRAIVESWLIQNGRKLNPAQQAVMNVALDKEVRPLYIKVVFDELVTRKSYDKDASAIPDTIRGCLDRLYTEMERKHGSTLVSRALGYLALSRNGLTEVEMEDLLSLDDTVLGDVFEFHVPPVRRLPSILWARIRSDLAEYLVYREADGHKVMAWYHRQFIEAAKDRYDPVGSIPFTNRFTNRRKKATEDSSEKLTAADEMTNVLYEYFSGTWAGGNPKPFTYTEKQCKKLGLSSPESSADRHVTDQPAIYGPRDKALDVTNIGVNRRKTSELPLIMTTMAKRAFRRSKEEMESRILNELIFNIDFFTAWIANSPWGAITKVVDIIGDRYSTGGDLDLDENAMMASEVSLWRQCMLLSYTTLYSNPSMFGQAFSARMLLYRGRLPRSSRLLEDIDSAGLRYCALTAPHLQMDTPGGELLYVVNNHLGPIFDSCWGDDDGQKSVSVSTKLVIIDLEQGQVSVDTRPRNVPEGDSFYRITLVDECVAVSLRDHPIIYFMESEKGQVQSLLDLRDHGAPDKFRIGHMDRYETSAIVVWTKGSPCLFYIIFTNDSDPGKVVVKMTQMEADIHSVSISNALIAVVMTTGVLALLVPRFDGDVTPEVKPGEEEKEEDKGENAKVTTLMRIQLPARDPVTAHCHTEQWELVLGYGNGSLLRLSLPELVHLHFQGTREDRHKRPLIEDLIDASRSDPSKWKPPKDEPAPPQEPPTGDASPKEEQNGTTPPPCQVTLGDAEESTHTSSTRSKARRRSNDYDSNTDSDSSAGSDVTKRMENPVRRSRKKSAETKHSKVGIAQEVTDGMAKIHSAEGPGMLRFEPGVLDKCQKSVTLDLDSPIHFMHVPPRSDQEYIIVGTEKSVTCFHITDDLQPVFEIRKFYKEAFITENNRFVLCHVGGQVDVFRMDPRNMKIQPLTTLEAHTKEITKLLTIDQDILFVTASLDGTVKFWNLERAKANSGLVPKFSRVQGQIARIDSVCQGDFTQLAITCGPNAKRYKSLDLWDVMSGQTLYAFRPPPDGAFVAHCVACSSRDRRSRQVGHLVALDSAGSLWIWKLDDVISADDEDEWDGGRGRMERGVGREVPSKLPAEALEQGVALMAFAAATGRVVIVTRSAHVCLLDIGQGQTPSVQVDCVRLADWELLSTVSLTREGDLLMLPSGAPHIHRVVIEGDGRLRVGEPLSLEEEKEEEAGQGQGQGVCIKRTLHSADGTALACPDGVLYWSGSAGPRAAVPCPGLREIRLAARGDRLVIKTDTDLQVVDCLTLASLLHHTPPSQPKFIDITPDGAYLLYVYAEKHLRVVRVRDGLVIAWYSMSGPISSLTVSSSGWFVLLGTADQRLFVLLLSDPEQPDTATRIQTVREYNPPLDPDTMTRVIAEAANMDNSSDSSDSNYLSDDSDDSHRPESGKTSRSKTGTASRSGTRAGSRNSHWKRRPQVVEMDSQVISRSARMLRGLDATLRKILAEDSATNPDPWTPLESVYLAPVNPEDPNTSILTPKLCALQ